MTTHRGLLAATIACTLAIGACDRQYDSGTYTLSPTSANAIISLSPSVTVAPADGVSRIVLTAKIDPQSTKREIQFSATDGTFTVGAQTDTKKATVIADATGTATTELRTSLTVGTVVVDATIQSDATHTFRQTVNLSFTTPSADDLIVLTVSSSSIPADGFSRARLTATAKVPQDPTKRTVTFKTSTGTLFASAQGSGGTTGSLDVTTDASGVAVAELQSTQVIETAFVSATVTGVTRAATVNFTAPNPSDIITLSTSSTIAPADGATLVQLTATVAAGLRSREVTFTVNDGKFTNGEATIKATADSSNRASVDLRAPTQATIVHARATVSSVTADTFLTFAQALPQSILVSPVSIQIHAGDSDTINVSLFRVIGVPSAGLVPAFTAKDPSGNVIGGFGAIVATTATTNPPGATTSATYNPSGTAYRGPVTIQVTVGTVTGTSVINIIP